MGRTYLLAAMMVASSSINLLAQVYSNTSTVPLPDLATTASQIVVAGGPASIGDVNVVVNVDHRTVGQLDLILVPPGGGAYVHLVSGVVPDGEDFKSTRFDDDSPVSILAGPPRGVPGFPASFAPEGGIVSWRPDATIPLPGPALANLSALDGTPADGTWTLVIDDRGAGNAGRLLYWSLEFDGAADPRGPSFGSAPIIVGGTCTPNPVIEGQSAVFTLQVEGGQSPASPILAIWGDASFAGGPSRTDFNDAGVDGDLIAGDSVYSATIGLGAYPGRRALDAHVLDAMGRCTKYALGFTITATPSGACCVGGECVVLREYECQLLGGDFTTGVDCFTGSYALEAGGGPFASIAGLGAAIPGMRDDDKVTPIEIGFPFRYFGNLYTTVVVSTNGNVQFPPSLSNAWMNLDFPNTRVPNNMIAPLWDDFDFNPRNGSGDLLAYLDESGGAGNRALVISWEGVERYPDLNDSNSFQLVLFESGSFEYRYGAITPVGPSASASIGFENATGTIGQGIPFGSLSSGNTARRVQFSPGPSICGVDPCAACAADFDQDGGVTGADISAFFTEFEQGLPCADVDLDGGITGGDVAAFFTVFEAGGC